MKLKDVIIILAVVAVLVVASYYAINVTEDKSLAGRDVNTNDMGYLVSSATSTGSYSGTEPVMLLEKDNDRRYAIIQNNSDTDIYLFATTTLLDYTGTGLPRYASGTVTVLNGIRLAPNDGDNLDDTYIIGSDNLFYGYIYASSTAGTTKKEVLVNYYQ